MTSSNGCSCFTALFRRRPNKHFTASHYYTTPTTTPTTGHNYFSDDNNEDDEYSADIKKAGFGRVEKESKTWVKRSIDPYMDFKQSMIAMIIEKQLFCEEDLRDLLNYFLHLNSTSYHGIIIRAFTEIWNRSHGGY